MAALNPLKFSEANPNPMPMPHAPCSMLPHAARCCPMLPHAAPCCPMLPHAPLRSPAGSGSQKTEIMGPAGANQQNLAQFFSVLLASWCLGAHNS
jgi:hypothetical protein